MADDRLPEEESTESEAGPKKPEMLSSTKLGGIYLQPCNQTAERMFPLEKNPSTWPSCHDAYEFTWKSDPDGLLRGLTTIQKTQLAHSSGFCPHLRCQLQDVGNADRNGQCSPGTCYTKLEHGSPSFGACCFTNGSFLSGKIVGYYDKLSPTPKPIYTAHRVLLGLPAGHPDTSADTFFNAHLLDTHLLVTQCPLRATIEATKRVMIEQRVMRWLQIYNYPAPEAVPKDCLLISDALAEGDFALGAVVTTIPSDTVGFLERSIALCYQASPFALLPFQADGQCAGEVHSLRYTAYTGWEDFVAPPDADISALQRLADDLATHVRDGEMIAINCLSGRGRSGSFASVVLGLASSSPPTSHDDLVALIVRMRERRDGLVETPRQYGFVSRLLALPDPTDPHSLPPQETASSRAGKQSALLVVFLLMLVLVLVWPARKRPVQETTPHLYMSVRNAQ